MQKVAFITGCSTGIGRELAMQLNNQGWKVVATARRIETLESLEKAGCLVLPLDVTEPRQIKKAVRDAVEICGRIDLLVNNAGYGLILPVLDIQEEELRRQQNTNITGVIQLIRKLPR